MVFGRSRKNFRYGVGPFGKKLEGYDFVDAENGRSRFAYTEEYYSRNLSDRAALRRRILNYVLSFAGLVLFIIAGIPRSVVNRSTYMGLAVCVFALLFMWFIYILVIMAINKNHLTIWAFRVSAIQFVIVSAILSVICIVSTIFTIVYALNMRDETLSTDIIGFIMRLAASAAFLIMTVLEFNTEYNVAFPK